MKIKKSLLFILIISIFTSALFAQTADVSLLTKKYLDLSTVQLEQNLVSDAYKSVNSALKLNETKGIPANVSLISSQVYLRRLEEIQVKKDYVSLNDVIVNLEKYPQIKDSAISKKLMDIELQQRLDLEEENRRTDKAILIAVFSVGGILILVIIVAFWGVFSQSRVNAKQTQQFEETLKMVAGIQQTNSQLLFGTVSDLQGMSGLRVAGCSWGVDALPSPELSDEEKEALKELAISCEDLGAKIDMVTNRKNNSKNVSELVYKLALALGCNQNTAKAYFCASMVYDAGFMAIPEEILASESLNDQEKEVLHDHVNKTSEYFEFVPDVYFKIFEDAARFHHENEDGSGYPEGIPGESIPQVAKLIHVAESYCSLVSRRNYREIMDKESAVKELLSRPDMYDETVVRALDSIV